MFPRVEASMLCFVLALLSPAVGLCAAAGNASAAPLSGGFSLPIVSNYPEILPAAGDVDLTYTRPKIAPVAFPVFSVVVGVGAGGARQFYKLALDFIGILTWMQCKPSNPPLRQLGPIYAPAASRQFKYVKPTDPICVAPYTRHGHDKCSFDVRFQTATAHGYLGTDEFSFDSSDGGFNTVPDLLFGCSHRTERFYNNHVTAGVISLSRHLNSFIVQLARHDAAKLRFSYCLPDKIHSTTGRHGNLRFGADVPNTSNALHTALLHTRTKLYYVGLAGISLDGRRLTRITPAMFQYDPNTYRGGAIIDVGTPLTKIVPVAYDILEAEVSAHLRRHGAHIVQVPGHRLCVQAVDLQRSYLPSMTLHFHEEGATKLHIKPQLLFTAVQHGQMHVCLAVVPDATRTVIGAAQQADTRFTFDLRYHKLFFAPEQCHQDS